MNLNGLEIDIIRSNRRKTVSINIERDGTVNIIVPIDLDESKIIDILKSKEYEIHRQITKKKELNKNRIERKFVPGQSFLFLGKSYNLQIVENQKEPLLLSKGSFLLSSNALTKAEDTFIKFYKKQGKLILDKRLETFTKKVVNKPNEVKIMELKTRWASCSSLGNVIFNWKIFMALPSVIDYIIVHELTHLKHPNHSRAFWDDVSTLMPDYKNHVAWLNKNGAKLTLNEY